MTKISKSEFKGRMRFLKKIVYFASLYDWKRLLQYYAAWLRRIEMGMNSWHDVPLVIESAILLNKPYNRKPGKNSVSKPIKSAGTQILTTINVQWNPIIKKKKKKKKKKKNLEWACQVCSAHMQCL